MAKKTETKKETPIPIVPKKEFKWQTPVLILLALLGCLSLFKNLSYPLIWNDESETVMMGTHVLEYGYPKVHDGKNTVFMMPVNHIDSVMNFRVGYDKEHDAFIGNTWGMYYVAAAAVWVAEMTDDIYQKTFWLRLPFALSALLGLVIFCFCCSRFFHNKSSFRLFAILFTLIELISIPLVYHMREARYYSLTIFIIAGVSYIYINYFFFRKYGNVKYILFLVAGLFISYHINFITYAILCAFIGIHEAFYFGYNYLISKGKLKDLVQKSWPTVSALGVSVILVYPFISFYDTISISQHVSNDYNFTSETYKANLGVILEFFKQQDFYYPALILFGIGLTCLWRAYSNKKIWGQLSKTNPSLPLQVQLHFFFLLLFFVYTFLIARSPYLFTRHFIVLQPVFTIIMCLNIFLVLGFITILLPKKSGALRTAFGVLCAILFFSNSSKKIDYVKEHIYQCTHQMKGVLDYQIPYILENFKEPEKLTIATNYEEFALMYYLKSRVVLGFIMNDLEEAMKLTPDLVIYRKGMGGNPQIFNNFLQKAKYNRVAFPVYDYPVNNIPEIEFMLPHLFRTKFAANEQEKADILVKDSLQVK